MLPHFSFLLRPLLPPPPPWRPLFHVPSPLSRLNAPNYLFHPSLFCQSISHSLHGSFCYPFLIEIFSIRSEISRPVPRRWKEKAVEANANCFDFEQRISEYEKTGSEKY
ncbi:hypothetical protein V6N13_129702 [Hibiscus sabdariffa]|uniref:Uncharacterized protein n=1 Tax=Hibiscus sabdariffa TaxID=183260 RepID=A0ABR2SMK4_9ROSI